MRISLFQFLSYFTIAYSLQQHNKYSHKIRPNKMDNSQIVKLRKMGFSYNESTQSWQRKRIPTNKKYGQSEPRNQTLEFIWKQKDKTPYTKQKNKKYLSKKISVYQNNFKHKLTISPQRFLYNKKEKKWIKDKPRFTPITLNVINKQRCLTIKAPPEAAEDIQKATYRLDYLLSQTSLESQTNIWNGILRVGRDPVTFYIWSAIQYKIWTFFSNNNAILYDAFNHSPYISNDKNIYIGLFIFLILGRIQKKLWDESSGPITTGAFEKSIADGILTNFTNAPLSYKKRESLGLYWEIIVALLTSISAIPRSIFFHEYIQPKIQSLSTNLIPISDSLNPSLVQTKIIILTCISCSLISVSLELVSLKWTRFSKSPLEEILYLSESIKMDATQQRMMIKSLEKIKNHTHHNNQITTNLQKQSLQNKIDAHLFESIATSWVQYFIPQYNFTKIHNQDYPLDTENIFLSNINTTRTIYLLLTHFISTQIIVFSYILTDIYTPILFHTTKEITNIIPLNKKILKNTSIEIIPLK